MFCSSRQIFAVVGGLTILPLRAESVNPVYSTRPCQQASSRTPSRVGGTPVFGTVMTGETADAARQSPSSSAARMMNLKCDSEMLLLVD